MEPFTTGRIKMAYTDIMEYNKKIVENIIASTSEGPHAGDYLEPEECPENAVDYGWFNSACVKYLDGDVCGVMIDGDGGEYYLPLQWGLDYSKYKEKRDRW